MEFTCAKCGGPLQATATADVTVIVCPACTHVFRLPHDGSAHTLASTLEGGAPAGGTSAETGASRAEDTHSYVGGEGDAFPSLAAFARGDFFGDYELIEEIARGGMGVVFKARQVSLNRPVALKMILSSRLASPEAVRRFCSEAEAAARLDHAGIVPIYEVGQHAGQHFFAMGLVEGGNLAELVAEGPLPPRNAAQLVKTIAEAVQFAHSRNIVHRDLKPANVLLDSQGQPKVADFGLAKNVEADAGLTASGQVLGTPSYMAPEQAAGRISEVGPPADVYALGALLYCLLTGRPPFRGESAVETLQQVVSDEPVSPRQRNGRVDLDLATICLKCLEKDPTRRYASAAALAEELGRFLAGEPIQSRPIRAPARAWRWCKRRPLVALLSAAAVLSLLAGTAVSTYFGLLAERRAGRLTLAIEGEKLATADARRQAEIAAEQSRLALETLESVVIDIADRLRRLPGSHVIRRSLLETVMARLQHVAAKQRDRIDRNAAGALVQLGEMLLELGDEDGLGATQAAMQQFRAAQSIIEALAEADSGDRAQWNLSVIHERIGQLLLDSGKERDAKPPLEKSLNIRRKLVEQHGEVPTYRQGLSAAYQDWGDVHIELGDLAAARRAYEAAMPIARQLVAEDAANRNHWRLLSANCEKLGDACIDAGDLRAAEKLYQEMLDIDRRLSEEQPDDFDVQWDLSTGYERLGNLRLARNDAAAARQAYQESLDITLRILKLDPNNRRLQKDLAITYDKLFQAHGRLGAAAAQRQAIQAALDIRERLARDDPNDVELQRYLRRDRARLKALPP